ncbi:MAG TPA: prepilin-type N-terminal cleavage/methylation domain-containing protein [Gemmatimonadaceae bacterium]|nr:prepilin-type N-terminal cleavage/methylation domain-containing protein [Gemmatimonadaceae bacterium]
MRLSGKKGFTLIELLIVVVIIGILAAIAIPKFANTKNKAYMASVKSDLRNLQTAEEAYYSDNQIYGTESQINFTPSANNTLAVSNQDAKGYTATITNGALPTGQNSCHVDVGAASADSTLDGVIQCP